MLILNRSDIMRSISYSDIVSSVRRAFDVYEKGNFFMPNRVHVDYGPNTLLLMPSFSDTIFGTKLINIFPKNPQKNRAAISGVMVLSDGETGETKAVLDASILTALRTGAVGSLGIEQLRRGETRTLGLIGAGVQGLFQILFALDMFPFSRVLIYDTLPSKVSDMIEEISKQSPIVNVFRAETPSALIAESDVIITATNSKQPVLPDDKELLAGKHYIGIGSYKPDMQEFPEALFRLAERIYIDVDYAVEESGDLINPLNRGWIGKDQVITLGKRLSGEDKQASETSMFKSVGMALFDLFTADTIYQAAVQKEIGIKADF